jgi:hypothetical protein
VRKARKFAIAGEIGWNSLSGLGANGTYNIIPQLSLDVGAGISEVGLKGGIRVRGNLLESEWTPVLGFGYLVGSGTGGNETTYKANGDEIRFKLHRSDYLQGVIGANYTSTEGFAFMVTAGYAWLLRENFVKVSGSDDLANDIKPMFHGGVVIATSFGWAF